MSGKSVVPLSRFDTIYFGFFRRDLFLLGSYPKYTHYICTYSSSADSQRDSRTAAEHSVVAVIHCATVSAAI